MPSKEEMRYRAGDLRNHMTPEERKLYYDLFKHLSVTVRRQIVIGDYIADFYVSSAKLVVEVDGSQHYEKQGKEWDERRDEFFRQRGLLMLRFSNADVNKRFRAVCDAIVMCIEERSGERVRYK